VNPSPFHHELDLLARGSLPYLGDLPLNVLLRVLGDAIKRDPLLVVEHADSWRSLWPLHCGCFPHGHPSSKYAYDLYVCLNNRKLISVLISAYNGIH